MWQWQPHVCVRAMTQQHPQLFVLIFLLVVAFISRYGNSTFSTKPVVLPPMPPRRFFPFDSLVVEFPFGSISSLLDLVRDDEIIFVMYYAPWCPRSMSIRWEFHKAASFMKDQVKFVAVNCWWNEGECHRKYKFISHPMLYVYHTNLDGFHYTGIPTADYFVHFLENIIYPITYLYDEKGIKKFVSLNDNVVIGYFDFNSSPPQPPGYQQFYYASMRAIEQSPIQMLKFGILTTPYHIDILNMPPKSSSAVLVKHGSIILNYPDTNNFTSSELVKWAFQEYQQPLVKILNPSGTKSLQLFNEIVKGPTLIMFSAHYPLFDINQYYHMLREVSLEYSKCEMDEISNENLLYSLTYRLSSVKKLQELNTCSREQHQEGSYSDNAKQTTDPYRFVSQKPEQQFPNSLPFTYLASSSSSSSQYSPVSSSSSLLACHCCVSVLRKHLLEGHLYRNVCEVCYNSVNSVKRCRTPCNCPKGSTYKFTKDHIYSALQNKCLQFSPNYMPTYYKSVCCHQMHTFTTSFSKPFHSTFSFPTPSYSASSNVPSSETANNKTPSSFSKESLTAGQDPVVNSSVDIATEDPFIVKVLKNRTQQSCDHYNLQFVQGVPIDTDLNVLSLTLVKNFSGLSCRTNKTVHFYAMDLINHWMFADRFGLNTTKLLETKQPAVVIIDMEDEKSYVLKKEFSKTSIAEFVLNYTEGHLEREMFTADVDRSSSSGGGSNCSLNPENCDQRSFDPLFESELKYLYITEVTAHTFHQIVLNTSKDVLLLYYAPWCGFCASFAHIYLSLAKYFRAATSLLFARINGDTEDLPWEFTADTYPTLLFFPSGRKEDSVVYSEDLPKTLTNLIRFVLHHATHTVSLWTDNSQQCTAHCIKSNRQNALIRISVLNREIKRLDLRLNHLENSVLKRRLLESAAGNNQLPESVQILGAMVTRAHWQKLIEKKKRQRSVCKKLVRFLKRKDSSLNKEDLVKFMKANDLLVNHFPSL